MHFCAIMCKIWQPCLQVVCKSPKVSNVFSNHDHHQVLPRHQGDSRRLGSATQNLHHRKPVRLLHPHRHPHPSLRLESSQPEGEVLNRPDKRRNQEGRRGHHHQEPPHRRKARRPQRPGDPRPRHGRDGA